MILPSFVDGYECYFGMIYGHIGIDQLQAMISRRGGKRISNPAYIDDDEKDGQHNEHDYS